MIRRLGLGLNINLRKRRLSTCHSRESGNPEGRAISYYLYLLARYHRRLDSRLRGNDKLVCVFHLRSFAGYFLLYHRSKNSVPRPRNEAKPMASVMAVSATEPATAGSMFIFFMASGMATPAIAAIR